MSNGWNGKTHNCAAVHCKKERIFQSAVRQENASSRAASQSSESYLLIAWMTCKQAEIDAAQV